MKRRNYSKSDDMISALHYVQKNPRSSIRKTAQKFGVSRTSLSHGRIRELEQLEKKCPTFFFALFYY